MHGLFRISLATLTSLIYVRIRGFGLMMEVWQSIGEGPSQQQHLLLLRKETWSLESLAIVVVPHTRAALHRCCHLGEGNQSSPDPCDSADASINRYWQLPQSAPYSETISFPLKFYLHLYEQLPQQLLDSS
jgi:hypothetical protein